VIFITDKKLGKAICKSCGKSKKGKTRVLDAKKKTKKEREKKK
jgi:hypothetical protein